MKRKDVLLQMESAGDSHETCVTNDRIRPSVAVSLSSRIDY